MPRFNMGAAAGIGGSSGAPDASPGATTVPGAGRRGGGWHNRKVLWLYAGAWIMMIVFHVGGARG
jgi:hypothetical protein